MINTDCLVLLG